MIQFFKHNNNKYEIESRPGTHWCYTWKNGKMIAHVVSKSEARRVIWAECVEVDKNLPPILDEHMLTLKL